MGGAEDQYHRHGNLGDDERFASGQASRRNRSGAVLLERGSEVDECGSQGRNRAKGGACEQRQCRRKEQDGSIGLHIDRDGILILEEEHADELCAPAGEQDSERPSGRSQHQTLGQELPDKAPARRPDGHSNGDFACPARRPDDE
jgi:hypothetical protein